MNIQELLESSKIENKDNIIKFLSANSYEEYKIIDENNCEVIINENEKIIIPNELIYSFVNICAPYNDVLKECVELFLNENNIILDESTSLANPNIFGALLISTENIDLFKDWYEYKNLLLNEDCMYINADDRVNILAQYLSINESFNEEKFLQLEVPDQFLNETIIGSVNGLYSLLEKIENLGSFSSKEEAEKAAQKNLISKIPFWRRIGLISSTFNQHSDINKNRKFNGNQKEVIDYSIKTKKGQLINHGQSYHIENKNGKWILSSLTNSKENPNNSYNNSVSNKQIGKDISAKVEKIGKGIASFGKKSYNTITSDNAKKFYKNSLHATGAALKGAKNTYNKIGGGVATATDWGLRKGSEIMNNIKQDVKSWNRARNTLGNSKFTGRKVI